MRRRDRSVYRYLLPNAALLEPVSPAGAWSDPLYLFSLRFDLPSFERSPLNGFRCVQYLGEESLSETLTGPVDIVTPDYRATAPVSDDVHELLERQFFYDPSDLNARVESIDESSDAWIKETITVDAGYGDEAGHRVPPPPSEL